MWEWLHRENESLQGAMWWGENNLKIYFKEGGTENCREIKLLWDNTGEWLQKRMNILVHGFM